MNRFLTCVALACWSALALVGRASAGDCCCSHCGGCGACQKVCRLVCEDKQVDVICWGVVCEDFCLGKPSEPGCKHCKTVCAECDAPCDPDAPHVVPKRFVWREWIPGCAKLFTKKKLMKKTETVTVPSYKWVVEDLCSHCESTCTTAVVDAATEAALPPPPVGEAKLLYSIK